VAFEGKRRILASKQKCSEERKWHRFVAETIGSQQACELIFVKLTDKSKKRTKGGLARTGSCFCGRACWPRMATEQTSQSTLLRLGVSKRKKFARLAHKPIRQLTESS